MKVLIFLAGLIFLVSFSQAQTSPEPLSNLLKLKWVVEIETKGVLPARIGQYLRTADNVLINGRTGEIVPLATIDKYSDSFLLNTSDYKLNVTNLKDSTSFERRRSRSYYIGKKEVQLSSDSLWIEIVKNTSIQAVNLLNNKILWTTQSSSRIFNKPVVINNEVVISNMSQLLFLNRQSGDVNKILPIGGPVLSGINREGNFLYMIAENEGLLALNLETKEVDWRISLTKYSSRANRIVVDNNRIYFSDNSLHAIDRDAGSLIWQVGEDNDVYIMDSGLTMIHEYLLFYTFKYNENMLTVVDKDTGKILARGSNSSVVGGDSNNSDGVAKEDLLLIDFSEHLIDDNILIGVMDNKLYGIQVLR